MILDILCHILNLKFKKYHLPTAILHKVLMDMRKTRHNLYRKYLNSERDTHQVLVLN